MDKFELLSWIAVTVLSASYWFQIWKIHVHREVRDLSLIYHILLALGFGILGFTAFYEESVIFLIKQIATTIPVLIIIGQIIYHRNDRWHDSGASCCISCTNEVENAWLFCPYCGHSAGDSLAHHEG